MLIKIDELKEEINFYELDNGLKVIVKEDFIYTKIAVFILFH